VKNLYPLFWKKSSEMVSLIKAEIDTKPNSSDPITGVVDMDDWSGRIGLDIIGKAGFGSDFNALSNPHTPLNTSYRDGFIPDKTLVFPALFSYGTQNSRVTKCFKLVLGAVRRGSPPKLCWLLLNQT
jgi:hypothetical protein